MSITEELLAEIHEAIDKAVAPRKPREVKSTSVALTRLATLLPINWRVEQFGATVKVFVRQNRETRWWKRTGTHARRAAIGFLADILMMPAGSGTGCLGLTPEAIQEVINWDTVSYPSIAGLSCHEEFAVERLLAVKNTHPMDKDV